MTRGMGQVAGVLLLCLSGCRCVGEDLDDALGEVVVQADAGPPSSVSGTGCWGPSMVVSPSPGPGAITVLESGDAVVAWHENNGLFARLLFLDGGMGPASSLQQLGGDSLEESQELVQLGGSDSSAAALWVHRWDAGASRELLIARFARDAGWQAPERLDVAPSFGQLAVAIDGAGQLAATWLRSDATSGAELVTRRWSGASWSALERVAPPQSTFGGTALRASPEGGVVLSWYAWYPPTFEARVHATHWTDGGRTDVVLSTGETTRAPVLDVDGQRAVVLTRWRPNERQVELARSNEGQWLTAALATGDVMWTDVNVGFDSTHRAAAWMLGFTSEPGHDQFWLASTVEVDGGWSALAREPLSGIPQHLQVFTNSRGRVVMSWTDDRVLHVRRPGAADDVITGLVTVPFHGLPALSVGSSGFTWLLANETSEPWRLVAMPCR